MSHISDSPRFLVVQKTQTKTPCTKSLLMVRGIFAQGFCLEYFVWKVLSGVVFVHSPSVSISPLQQKVKHHFQYHVSYVIMNDKKFKSVMSHALGPLCHKLSRFLGPPSPSSMTYFMGGPLQ